MPKVPRTRSQKNSDRSRCLLLRRGPRRCHEDNFGRAKRPSSQMLGADEVSRFSPRHTRRSKPRKTTPEGPQMVTPSTATERLRPVLNSPATSRARARHYFAGTSAREVVRMPSTGPLRRAPGRGLVNSAGAVGWPGKPAERRPALCRRCAPIAHPDRIAAPLYRYR